MRCPDRILLVGGGRWARVILGVLVDLVPPSVAISVHSRRGMDSMIAWGKAKGLEERIEWSPTWPPSGAFRKSAAIVANAARDHEPAAEWALANDVPVLVEKPIALTQDGAARLVRLAAERKGRIAAAHVFLFARYIENFAGMLDDWSAIESIRMEWIDPAAEDRYGETKRYDASVPVFADWLPHIVSVITALLRRRPGQCRKLALHRGGAALELELLADGIPCSVRIERNAESRRRAIRAVAGGEVAELDFSSEPGVIVRGFSRAPADPGWDSQPRPLARMLTAFLEWAAGGRYDTRLDVETGVLASKLIDQVSPPYLSALVRLLADRLSESVAVDEDVRYALSELLQMEGRLPPTELDRQIGMVAARFRKADRAAWSAHAGDALKALKSLAA